MQPKLSGPGKDADPLLVLTEAAPERYGLPVALTDESDAPGGSGRPQGHQHVLDPRMERAMFRIVSFLARQQRPTGSFVVRHDQAGVDVGAVAEHDAPFHCSGRLALRRTWASALLPGAGGSGGHDQTGVGVDDDLQPDSSGEAPAAGAAGASLGPGQTTCADVNHPEGLDPSNGC